MKSLDKEIPVKLISAINMTKVMVVLIRKTVYMKLRIAIQIAILKGLGQIKAVNITKVLYTRRMPV
ncbi:hypothetical protein DMI82_04200 [Blautia sp. BCRC 81119]|nr:hypothetical protein DMI82_04200 [Blautia sp. BCRC 81119]